MLSKTSTYLSTTLITLTIPSLSIAGEYQHQASLGYYSSEFEYEASSYSSEGDTISIDYLYALAPVKTDDIFLNEALFLNKSSAIFVGASHYSYESNNIGSKQRSHENHMNIGGQWTTDNDLAFGLSYQAPVSDEEGTFYSIGTMFGAFLTDQTLVAALIDRNRYKSNNSNDRHDSYTLMLKSIVPLPNETAWVINPYISSSEGRDEVALYTSYYFNHQIELGIHYSRATGDRTSDTQALYYNHYLSESIGLDITLFQSESEGGESDTLSFGLNYRY